MALDSILATVLFENTDPLYVTLIGFRKDFQIKGRASSPR
jgi:hypothetical protein